MRRIYLTGSENGVKPFFVSFPVFLPCMGRGSVPGFTLRDAGCGPILMHHGRAERGAGQGSG